MNVSITKASFIRCRAQAEELKFGSVPDVYNSRETVLDPGLGIDSFLRTFNVEKGVYSAVISASALGIFDLYVNGMRIGREELKPGWTDYDKRVFVFTYDISTYIRYGQNTVYARVSRGWYSGRISFGIRGNVRPAFICGIDLGYDDGEREYIYTGDGWKCALLGPVMTADIWNGEYYDARITEEQVLSSDKWEKPAVVQDVPCELENPVGPPVRARREFSLKPVSSTVYRGVFDNGSDFGEIRPVEKKRGDTSECAHIDASLVYQVDFAQNMVGRPKFTVSAPAGTKITVRCGEMLNDSGMKSRKNDGPLGSIYTANYRSAISQAVYICGGGTETYFPTHAFYGFRYLEFEADAPADISGVTGEVLGSDIHEVAHFECSDREINTLYSNILWGQRSNYLSVPTDCPQRDERVGWTGDTQIFCGAAAYNADVSGFFKKWLGDCRDSQGEDGSIGDVMPKLCNSSRGNNSNAAWADAVIIVPYRMFRFYDDKSFLAENYGMMEKYMQLLASNENPGPNIAYGDWLSYDATDKRYIADCYYAYDALLMALISTELNNIQRAVYYTKLFTSLKEAFCEKYVHDDNITEKTQTGCLLALHFELLDGKTRENTAALLAELIKSNNYTLSTGFVGTGILNVTLSEVGLDELAYSLLLQTRDPSWLYSVRQGATTVWERWNSYTLDKGFGNVCMNSFNHYAYGAVSEWLFSYAAGIGLGDYQNGFSFFTYRPRPDMRAGLSLPKGQKPITYIEASYYSDAGLIKTRWERRDDRFIYTLTVPEGAKAKCMLPVTGRITCDRKPVAFPAENGFYTAELSGGEYEFEVSIGF